jgi:IclR family acetate operon transcriptional repressor
VDGYATNTLDSIGSAQQTTEDNQLKPRIQSAVRTVAILLAVADSPNGLRAKEIMDRLGLSRQVTYHLIHTMHGTGIIRKNDSNRFSPATGPP